MFIFMLWVLYLNHTECVMYHMICFHIYMYVCSRRMRDNLLTLVIAELHVS